MEYRNLGNTGLRVSELCLGCMTFARESDEAYPYQFIQNFAYDR
jgi:aryl-alcohol dehydrogenase-like predicted oxidoreductase